MTSGIIHELNPSGIAFENQSFIELGPKEREKKSDDQNTPRWCLNLIKWDSLSQSLSLYLVDLSYRHSHTYTELSNNWYGYELS